MSIPCDMLLHPELLTNEQLITVILERHLRIPNLQYMCREELLELFHNFCVPYSQRRSRDCVRGKTKTNNDYVSPGSSEHNQNHLQHISQTNDRVKPPPDILSGHMKRIKINGNLDVRNISSGTDKCVIKRKIESQDFGVSPMKKGRKPITWP